MKADGRVQVMGSYNGLGVLGTLLTDEAHKHVRLGDPLFSTRTAVETLREVLTAMGFTTDEMSTMLSNFELYLKKS